VLELQSRKYTFSPPSLSSPYLKSIDQQTLIQKIANTFAMSLEEVILTFLRHVHSLRICHRDKEGSDFPIGLLRAIDIYLPWTSQPINTILDSLCHTIDPMLDAIDESVEKLFNSLKTSSVHI